MHYSILQSSFSVNQVSFVPVLNTPKEIPEN